MLLMARHNRSAPVATAFDHKGYPQNPRSASSTIPGSSLDHFAGKRVLPGRVGADRRLSKTAWVPHSASATTRACGNAARSPLFTPGRPNQARWRRCQRHQDVVPSIATMPPPSQPQPGAPGSANGVATRSNSAFNGSGTQPGTGLEDRRLTRQSVGLARHPARSPRQPVGQQTEHVLVGALGVQRHPNREVGHHPRRQRPVPLLSPPNLGDHLINQPRRERPGQHPHRHQIRQPTLRHRLGPSSTRHTTQTTPLPP
jgi:hypothetical protein